MPDDGPAQAAGLFACADDCSGATFVALTAGSSWPRLCENFFKACFQGSSDPSLGVDRRSWIDLEGRLFEIARVFGVFTQVRRETGKE